MKGRECWHCKQWIEDGADHDCWTTTEEALTKDLPDELRDAWERLRETAAEFGEQTIYASHHSIMFARKSCYFFVRPQSKRLEVVFFVGRDIKSPLIHMASRTSKIRIAHMVRIVHRDQVEPPLTDWLREAYDHQNAPKPAATAKPRRSAKREGGPKPKGRRRAKPARKARSKRKTSR